MNQNNEHIDSKPLPPKHEKLFTEMDVVFNTSKDKMWEQFTETIDLDKPCTPKTKHIYLNWKRWASVAAILLIALVTSIWLKTETITSTPGQHVTHLLPDGSKIHLNAATAISYNSILWYWKRELTLDGEAFFEVKKGEKFTVKSRLGKTEVLGTSFNIYARKSEYTVYCKTGKVKITIKNDLSKIIKPGEMVHFNSNGDLITTPNVIDDDILFWQEGKMKFISKKLPLVLEELERQYDVQIKYDSNNLNQHTYTGYFKKDKEIDTILNMIAISLNLEVTKKDNKHYIVN